MRPTGACIGVAFQRRVGDVGPGVVDGGCPGRDVHGHVLGPRRPGPRTDSERDGRVLLDLLGYPKAPASVSQTAYANGSLTLRVDPGEARQAYPGLSGFVIRSNGQDVAECSATAAARRSRRPTARSAPTRRSR